MKHLIVALIIFISTSISSIGQEKLNIDIKNSTVYWKGTMLFDFGGHNGTVKFKQGFLIRKQGKITGGEFTIDMNTMRNTDGDYSSDLIEHLKNEDFFDVPKHPTAKLMIKSVRVLNDGKMETHADLTIKGITRPIKYLAEIDELHTRYRTKFKIDRTEWGVMYSSKGTMDVKDYAISDAIEFEVELAL